MDGIAEKPTMQDKTGLASYIGSGLATAVGVLSLQEWAALIGILIAVATFAVNWHYKRKAAEAAERADEEKERYFRHRRKTDGDSG